MFKLFFWKIFLCVVPVLICSLAIADAVEKHRFKLGVDLVGGTILVYEIDTRKLMVDGKQTQDPKEMAQKLAEKLKNRIDPNDLYNVLIRPAGGEGRVEIILPTGGTANQEQHKQEWEDLLRQMEKKYDLPENALKMIPRGQVQKLTDKILQIVQQDRWEKMLYAKPESKKELMGGMLDPNKEEKRLRPLFEEFVRERNLESEWRCRRAAACLLTGAGPWGPLLVAPIVVCATTPSEAFKPGMLLVKYDTATKSLKFDYTKSLRDLMHEVKELVDDNRMNREIDGWFKQQAWRKMIGLMMEKWPILKERQAAFDKIAPGAMDELVGRVELKGDSMGQAFLTVLEPVVGKEVLADRSVDKIDLDDKGKLKDAKDENKFINAKTALKFVLDYFGPSAQLVDQQIEKINITSGRSRDLTVEEVQRIKDLVNKVGSLEFRILANDVDDKAAIKDAKDLLDQQDPLLLKELEDAQNKGLPPPAPRDADGPKAYTINLRGGKCKVTYSWVELGQTERKQLGLNNTAIQEGGRGQAWSFLNAKRNQAVQIPLVGETAEQKMLQGALFYSRECQDRNLPEEERRAKKYEYFILTRNPEIDPATGLETPKIDGSYLINASSQPDNTGRPAVSFVFNNAGGRLFGDVTRKNTPTGEESGRPFKRHLAIILDGLVMSAPTINSEIREQGQISGDFSNREVDALVNILRAGALPATLKTQPVSENTMGSTLGGDTISKGRFAIVTAFVVVLLFMIVYYRFAGLVASAALLANLILTVGFMVAVRATFTLPGMAGLVLMLGMAVDANILIYERLREERDRGASILLALRNGYDRAFGTIIDTHLSSIFTAVVLYIVGNDQLKGFGVSLTVGLLISLYTSLFMTRVIFDFWAAMGWLKKLSMLRFFSKPDIDFMTIRYYLFAATGALTVLGGALFIGRLPDDLNIDFVGGTAYSGQLVEGKAKTIEQMRDFLDEANQKERLTAFDTSKKAKVVERDEQGHIYDLWYGSGDDKDPSKRTIVLANSPVGETKEKREENIAERASVLPDWAVEQIFLDSFQEANSEESRFFTVRTTEKEPDLVQAVLDQLLQEKDKSGNWIELLKKVNMEVREIRPGTQYRIAFTEDNPRTGGKDKSLSSPSFVTTLLTRQLMIEFNEKKREKLPFTFELSNEDEDPSGDGRFRTADLSFSFQPPSELKTDAEKREDKLAQDRKIKAALETTANEFRRRPQPERLETFDSQLAAETRLRAMYAILLSWAAILLYLWFRFGSWTFGLAAVLCLIHDLFFTLGVIAMCHYVNKLIPGFLYIEDFKIDLPAVAALLTLVGYSVNDTIVVFDRIREVRGKNPDLTPQMINDSVNQTLSRTLLSSLTTWLVVIVLYVAGGPGVHLFAFVMVVGVVVGTYSSIYVASPLLLLFGEGGTAPARTPQGGPKPIALQPDVRIQPAAS